MQLYGIPNCNTVKKARDWLSQNKITYTFHDFKKEPPTEALIKEWLKTNSWENLINRAGMTWRNLSEADKLAVSDSISAMKLMISKPSVIKRPILIKDGKVLALGFAESAYESLFK